MSHFTFFEGKVTFNWCDMSFGVHSWNPTLELFSSSQKKRLFPFSPTFPFPCLNPLSIPSIALLFVDTLHTLHPHPPPPLSADLPARSWQEATPFWLRCADFPLDRNQLIVLPLGAT